MRFKNIFFNWWALLIAAPILLLPACKESTSTPKPRGYHRIDFPKKAYKHFDEGCKYSFDIPVYAKVATDNAADAQSCWINIEYPQFNGKLHLSYHDINNDKKKFNALAEDSRSLVFKHTIKATSIDESVIKNEANKVYGTYYSIDGNAASSLQFYLTDSSKHFLRAALYFRSEPRLDSIQPVLDFIKKDVDVMIKTFKWKQ
ncbi:gliding motility lipoprotein GldD [Solitalea sp. MAHUQ-68]|uniref:Gliding motility lipoprotein GldD n=1 Tax=Solitalea agri TaxID=2953739 RepID=A0A9X2F2M8_9SPHI|nr:gliding motility lipoprotein GldD [Solitalea agri]MCO4293029.1 gliding motility lipoprotein GldD [Solitalea agri]